MSAATVPLASIATRSCASNERTPSFAPITALA